MVPLFASKSGFTSCIKINGVPILPPLITDERRQEIKEAKEKAIEIENRLKQKRTSIDSGVMTGSYIDSLKNSEVVLTGSTSFQSSSGSHLINENCHQSNELAHENVATDSFLKSALEDIEFREFFYTTAEKIFKDNKLPDKTCSINDISLLEHNDVRTDLQNCNDHMGTTVEQRGDKLYSELNSTLADVSPNNVASAAFENGHENPSKEKGNIFNLSWVEFENPTLPSEPRVRRNSYTLESPSPVLLEHLAKQREPTEQQSRNWEVLSEGKTKKDSLGFQTFSPSKHQRKTWNKKTDINCADKFTDLCNSKSLLKKSTTVVNSNQSGDDLNYSLPYNLQISPTTLSPCDKSSVNGESVLNKPLDIANKEQLEDSMQKDDISAFGNDNPKTTREANIGYCITNGNHSLSNDNYNKSCLQKSKTCVTSPDHDMSNVANVDPPTTCLEKSDSYKLSDTSSLLHKNEIATDGEDTISMCSSLSFSKFMSTDDNESRPLSAEDLSSMLSELQLKHERQLAELINMQQKEKLMFSKLQSGSSDSISAKSNALLSVSECNYNHNYYQELPEERTPCSRELFPMPLEDKCSPEINNSNLNPSFNKIAGVKLSAYVRGYLTRRLLKTEKVQQLIDTIKESLNCAFSLQSESQLRKNDLELHERLAYQLTAALYELQTIISASVATRMAIIATDREKLRRPVSRPSSAISSATQKSLLRRQKSMHSLGKRSLNANKFQEVRSRTKSLCMPDSTSSTA